MSKKAVDQVLSILDTTSSKLESLVKAGKVDRQAAAQIIHNLDSFADKLQIAAYGKDNLKSYISKVIKRDSDEPYMETFENVNKVIKSDPDEPYMHKTEPSFNSKGIDNYDQDRSSTVSDRDEYQVRDLSEYAEPTKRQPSWSRGPAGKSTRQGSVKNPSEKQWAP